MKIHAEDIYYTKVKLCINKFIPILLNSDEIVHVFYNFYTYFLHSSEENPKIFVNIDGEIKLSNKYINNYVLYSRKEESLPIMLNKLNVSHIWHGYNSPRGIF